jgi:outer membrane protein OmpA-like peptidoglycan-associated protein
VTGEAPQAAAAQALVDGGFIDITVAVADGTAVLTGSVETEEAKDAAGAAVGAVAGVTTVDNRLAVTPPPPPDPAEIPGAAEQARDEAGFAHLGVTVIDGTATITGVIPLDELDGGYFAYTAPLRDALLAVNGIDAVRTRLQLRGDEGTLSRELDALVEASPIAFASDSAALTAENEQVLDQAAVIIGDHPGLRVIVAGHTDPAGAAVANEVLARERAEAVVGYLISLGIPPTRLTAITYGELFPDLAGGLEASRRIAFEVAP